MNLDPDPVELPFDGRELEARDRVVDALGGRGEHGQDRPEELETDGAKPLLTGGDRELGGARQVAGQHQRTSHDVRRDSRGLRDCVDHEPGESPLSELAGEQASEKPGLLLGRPAQKLGEQLPAFVRGAATGGGLDVGDRSINLADGKRRLDPRPNLQAVDGRITNPDAPLPWSP